MDRTDLAYTLMNQRDFPGFGFMIEKGATTIWETFQGDVSHSHPMFGSVCAWYYQHLGGISPDQDHPGFKHSIIKPSPVTSLTYANTSFQSPYGTIKTGWRFVGDDYQLNVSIPPNTSATVYVPACSQNEVMEGGQKAAQSTGIDFIGLENDRAVFKVRSGSYGFMVKQ
jgi:alpha-L-rhamnosidase